MNIVAGSPIRHGSRRLPVDGELRYHFGWRDPTPEVHLLAYTHLTSCVLRDHSLWIDLGFASMASF
jgi:hypothetical protein